MHVEDKSLCRNVLFGNRCLLLIMISKEKIRDQVQEQYLICPLIILLLLCISKQVLFLTNEDESDYLSLCDIDE